MILESFSPEDTKKIAKDLAQKAKSGDIFCLTGDLGVGKTAFSKGFAEGLFISDDVTSPTFSIVNIYEGKFPFYHFDVYRIENEEAMEDTGFEEYFYGDGICLVEWADNIKGLIPKEAIWINISKNLKIGESYRLINIEVD